MVANGLFVYNPYQTVLAILHKIIIIIINSNSFDIPHFLTSVPVVDQVLLMLVKKI